MVIELDDVAAPGPAANFRKLVSDGFYNHTTFHRVIPNFIIQGGDPNSQTDERTILAREIPATPCRRRSSSSTLPVRSPWRGCPIQSIRSANPTAANSISASRIARGWMINTQSSDMSLAACEPRTIIPVRPAISGTIRSTASRWKSARIQGAGSDRKARPINRDRPAPSERKPRPIRNTILRSSGLV